MNLKKIVAISDHLTNRASPRKKLVSGFGVGFVSFFIFLFILFSNSSLKNIPDSHKVFIRGFSISNNTSCRTAVFLENSTQLEQISPKTLVSESKDESNGSSLDIRLKIFGTHEKGDTHLGKLSGDVKNRSFSEISGKVVDFKDAHLIDFKKENFSAISMNHKGGDVAIGQDIGNESVKSDGLDQDHVKNGSFNETSAKVIDFKDANLIDLIKENFSAISIAVGQEIGNGSVKSDGLDQDHGKISQNLRNLRLSFEECDIFDGRWVKDDTKPYYPAGSCPYVDKDVNCHLNKRPDDEFVKWRWRPFGCEIPSLNATDFLERLRGKKMVFVGDSLNRNMWESLVCILRHSLENKKRVYEISGRGDFKKRGIYAFRFEDYNCTVDFVSSPFLVRESSFKGENSSFETLRLDLMDRTTSMYQDADILIFNTGHWWTHEKTSRGENYYQEGNHVYPRLKALDAYTRALSTWAKWVDKNIDSQKTQVIFRGYSLTHFRGGQWNSGGQCHSETEPIFNTSQLTSYPSKMRAFDNVLRVIKTPVIYLNISRLTDYRKDGHPSIYRTKYKSVPLKQQTSAEHSQDCSHWCLPGVPDTWNELLYASLLKVGRGSWKR